MLQHIVSVIVYYDGDVGLVIAIFAICLFVFDGLNWNWE
jgi:hypothetical protein